MCTKYCAGLRILLSLKLLDLNLADQGVQGFQELCDKMVKVVVTTFANKTYVSMQTTGGKHVY